MFYTDFISLAVDKPSDRAFSVVDVDCWCDALLPGEDFAFIIPYKTSVDKCFSLDTKRLITMFGILDGILTAAEKMNM